MIDTPPGHRHPNSTIKAYWDHNYQGEWVLYAFTDPTTGEVQYFEYHEYKGRHTEITEADLQKKSDLLRKNREVYQTAKGGFSLSDPFF